MELPQNILKPETRPESNEPIEHIQKFNALNEKNIKYEISMYKRGIYFILETEIIKDSIKLKYYNNYDLKSLKEINKFLSICDNIDDIIDTLYEQISNYSCKIIEKNNEYEIKIPVPVKSIKEIKFILKEKKKNLHKLLMI